MPTSLQGIEDTQTLAQAIVDTIHEPLLVLDAGFCVLAASRSFYATFQVDPEHTMGRLLYSLGDGQWNIPALRLLLETIIPERTAMDGFEVEHDFPGLGQRTMLLNARKVIYERSANTTILLAFTDITARRAIEREKQDLLERTEELLALQHQCSRSSRHFAVDDFVPRQAFDRQRLIDRARRRQRVSLFAPPGEQLLELRQQLQAFELGV